MQSATQDTTLPIADNVVIEAYDTTQIDGLSGKSRTEKIEQLDAESPDAVLTDHNTLTDDYLGELIKQLSPNVVGTKITATHVALGDDDSSFDRSDSSLNNELYRFQVDDSTRNDRELATATLIEAGQAVGDDLLEVGLVDDTEGILLNHTSINDPDGILQPKLDEYAALIKVDIRLRDISEVTS